MSTTEKGALPAPDAGRSAHLGDFTLTRRVLVITAWALPVGGASALAALALLRLIGLITTWCSTSGWTPGSSLPVATSTHRSWCCSRPSSADWSSA